MAAAIPQPTLDNLVRGQYVGLLVAALDVFVDEEDSALLSEQPA